MKRINSILIWITFCLICYSQLGYAQSEEIKIKESFVQTVQDELESLNELGVDEKENPIKSLQNWGGKNGIWWHAYYDTYDNFSYDIQKTNSIVTPYIGIVTFHGYAFLKEGTTKEECLIAKWVLYHESKPTLKYAFQDGKWILKEVPGAYRKH